MMPRCEAALIVSLVGLSLGWITASACATAGSRLAVDDNTTSTGAGGVSSGGAGASALGGQGGSGGTGGSGGDPEPAGPTRLTVVNGVVDQDALRLCFVPYPAGGPAEPWPGLAGLAFAHGSAVNPIGDVIPDDADVQLYVIGGDLSATAGMSCADLIDAPPTDAGSAPRVVSAGVLPESAFDAERSLLLVTYGCLGGAGHEHESQELICGTGYDPSMGNVGLTAGFMSRQAVSQRIGMQFVHASAAMPLSTLRVKAGIENATPFVAVSTWTLGAILPYPPWWQFEQSTLGNPLQAGLEIYVAGQSTPTHESTFEQALANSSLDAAELVDGEGFVFVAVGAGPGVTGGSWWHPLQFTIVRAEP